MSILKVFCKLLHHLQKDLLENQKMQMRQLSKNKIKQNWSNGIIQECATRKVYDILAFFFFLFFAHPILLQFCFSVFLLKGSWVKLDNTVESYTPVPYSKKITLQDMLDVNLHLGHKVCCVFVWMHVYIYVCVCVCVCMCVCD